jgi:hypothetical protein
MSNHKVDISNFDGMVFVQTLASSSGDFHRPSKSLKVMFILEQEMMGDVFTETVYLVSLKNRDGSYVQEKFSQLDEAIERYNEL